VVKEPVELAVGDTVRWRLGVVHRFDASSGERLG
jgi:mannose-6-phosphate isomerase-like protein (cupin superfamily)